MFEAEGHMLCRRGHTVRDLVTSSDAIRAWGGIGSAWAGLSAPFNPIAALQVAAAIRKMRPAVLHVHNTFPLWSPAALWGAAGTDTAVVMTLHNYRLFCAAAIAMRSGIPCTECLTGGSFRSASRYRCYRGSRLATVPVAATVALHRGLGTWKKAVHMFVALSEFQRELFVRAGLPPARIVVKAPVVTTPPMAATWSERGDYACFVGRLSEEKGVHTVIEAWARLAARAPALFIIGDGPLRRHLEARVSELGLGERICFRGQVTSTDVQDALRRAKLLVVPSLSFEGFPMVVAEARAAGVPVAASRLGSLPEAINQLKDGVVFEPGDAVSLADAVAALWTDADRLERMSTASFDRYRREYSEAANYSALMGAYAAAMSIKSGGAGPLHS